MPRSPVVIPTALAGVLVCLAACGESAETGSSAEPAESADQASAADAPPALRPVPGLAGNDEIERRLDTAYDLIEADLLDEALEEVVWIWDFGADVSPGFEIRRGIVLEQPIAALAQLHPPARERFAEIRDALTPRISEPPADLNLLDDWIVLNTVLGESEATLLWFDAAREHDPRAVRALAKRLDATLRAHARWQDLGEITREPYFELGIALNYHAQLMNPPPDADPDFIEAARADALDAMEDTAAGSYTALAAAGREDEALELVRRAATALGDRRARVACVTFALDEQIASPAHLAALGPLDESDDAVRALRSRARALLAAED